MSSIKEHSKSSCWCALGNVLIQGIGYQRENKHSFIHSFIHSFPGFARNQRSSRSLLPCLHTIWHLTNIVKQCFSETLSTTNKALAKRTCKSMQVHASVQNQDCVKTCDGWPNGFTSPLTSSLKSHKAVNVTHIQKLVINLSWLALGGQTVKKICRLAYKYELDQSQCKSIQVGGQTKSNKCM